MKWRDTATVQREAGVAVEHIAEDWIWNAIQYQTIRTHLYHLYNTQNLSINQSINQSINLFADSQANNKMAMNKNNHYESTGHKGRSPSTDECPEYKGKNQNTKLLSVTMSVYSVVYI